MKKILYCIVVIVLVGVSTLSFSSAKEVLNLSDATNIDLLFSSTKQGDSLVDVLITNQELTKQRRGLILHFCDSVLRTKGVANDGAKDIEHFGFDVDTYKYDPRQSLFIYGLCVTIDEESKGRTISGNDHVYRDYKSIYKAVSYPESGEPVELDVTTYWKEGVSGNELWGLPRQEDLDGEVSFSVCNPTQTMDACSFSSFAPVIFKNIMNEYSNIKLASIYGYKSSWDSDIEILKTAIENFSDRYFKNPGGENAPCDYSGLSYLSNESLSGKQAHCSHPETTQELEATIKSAQNLIGKLQFLDHDKIMDPFQKAEKSLELAEYCNEKKKATSPKHLLHACAFTNRGDVTFDSDWKNYHNTITNEYLWYSLFLTYYSNVIATDTAYSGTFFGSITASYKSQQRELRNITYEKVIAQKAIEQSVRMLTNVYTTFPSYIALKAYKEDLLNYREALAKTYTPLHQLYYTFRNVQACQDGQ